MIMSKIKKNNISGVVPRAMYVSTMVTESRCARNSGKIHFLLVRVYLNTI